MEKILESYAIPDIDVKKLNFVTSRYLVDKKLPHPRTFPSSESDRCKSLPEETARSKRKALEVTKISIGSETSPRADTEDC